MAGHDGATVAPFWCMSGGRSNAGCCDTSYGNRKRCCSGALSGVTKKLFKAVLQASLQAFQIGGVLCSGAVRSVILWASFSRRFRTPFKRHFSGEEYYFFGGAAGVLGAVLGTTRMPFRRHTRCYLQRHFRSTPGTFQAPYQASFVASFLGAVKASFRCSRCHLLITASHHRLGCFQATPLQRHSGGGAFIWQWEITVPVMAVTFRRRRLRLKTTPASLLVPLQG